MTQLMSMCHESYVVAGTVFFTIVNWAHTFFYIYRTSNYENNQKIHLVYLLKPIVYSLVFKLLAAFYVNECFYFSYTKFIKIIVIHVHSVPIIPLG